MDPLEGEQLTIEETYLIRGVNNGTYATVIDSEGRIVKKSKIKN